MNPYQNYRAALSRLPIQNPTEDDMAALCPHLTKEQAVGAFMSCNGYVVCPPLRVQGAFHALSYMREQEGGEGIVPPTLSLSFTGRTRASYTNDAVNSDIFNDHPGIAEATEYAEANWSSELVSDTWTTVLTIYVQDPTKLTQRGDPMTKAALHVTLNRELNEIINDYTRPQSQQFDDAIIEMTLDEMVWRELRGGRGGYTDYSCAYCGSGLSLSECNGCGHKFKDDYFRCGWSTPLSKKMVELLRQSGHVFKQDPEIAWIAEEKAVKAVQQRKAIELAGLSR